MKKVDLSTQFTGKGWHVRFDREEDARIKFAKYIVLFVITISMLVLAYWMVTTLLYPQQANDITERCTRILDAILIKGLLVITTGAVLKLLSGRETTDHVDTSNEAKTSSSQAF